MIGTLCATLAAVDGDTIKCNGINMRDMGDGAPFVSGCDMPEIRSRKCQAVEPARKAKAGCWPTPGVQVIDSGKVDNTGPIACWFGCC